MARIFASKGFTCLTPCKHIFESKATMCKSCHHHFRIISVYLIKAEKVLVNQSKVEHIISKIHSRAVLL